MKIKTEIHIKEPCCPSYWIDMEVTEKDIKKLAIEKTKLIYGGENAEYKVSIMGMEL